jgi:hypothetical protein
MMHGWNTGMSWGFGAALLCIVLIVGALIGIFFLVRWLVNNRPIYAETSEGETPQNAK